MPENRVSAVLDIATRDKALALFRDIEALLPFLVSVPGPEIQGLVKAGDKSRGFIQKAYDLAEQHPHILPRAFDLAEMKKDVDLVQMLSPLLTASARLHGKLDNTYTIASSESYAAALAVYGYAKASRLSDLDDALDDLGSRFARKSQPAEKDGDQPGPA